MHCFQDSNHKYHFQLHYKVLITLDLANSFLIPPSHPTQETEPPHMLQASLLHVLLQGLSSPVQLHDRHVPEKSTVFDQIED